MIEREMRRGRQGGEDQTGFYIPAENNTFFFFNWHVSLLVEEHGPIKGNKM